MPEITSVDRIREKLREFDERVDGAVAAAKTLVRVKGEAEGLLADIQRILASSEQSNHEAESLRLRLQRLQEDWDGLREQVAQAQKESRETQDLLLSECDSAIRSLGQKTAEAEERLRAANESSLVEQANLLKGLDASTRANAEAVASAKTIVLEHAERLGDLLGSVRDELQGETRARLLDAEKLLDARFTKLEQEIADRFESTDHRLAEATASNERLLREQIDAFKQEMRSSLSEHQHSIDRQLTDFLNKQNALVQNLTQQIDSYNRVSQALSADLASTQSRLTELSSGLDTHRGETQRQLAALTNETADLRRLLTETGEATAAQAQSLSLLNSWLQDVASRLDDTIEKLKGIPLAGRKFR